MYVSKTDAIEQVIVPAIEANGAEVASRDEYDLDVIFDATFEYSPELGGYVSIADHDEFWAAVQAAAK
ncbi:hypothetical protein [Arthrobacter bambusae]|uniref:Uncharacterized protein n=1 Tax=Arthrobacter bambusae TaxID=1338426 RepID=A0AAW8DDT6_9MICC|nr:hypothetical protein [Arthrobacter bambusae]MDP9903239.1 hypothetical protein [Arthrobacter bambusae]MDQ0128767.1 hypothetical protein [Arthrobacter bambusae]MDQ0180108.1 hypothetical protein [Arthrobacter bambusae]